MRLIAVRKADQNLRGIDPWTMVHLSAGLALGLMQVPFRSALVVSALYEGVEQVMERHVAGQRLFNTSGPEAALNSALDLVALALGHRIGTWWNET